MYKVQKPDHWLLSLLDEGHNANVAWILAMYLSMRAPEIKVKSEICGGHFVTKIAQALGYYNERELDKLPILYHLDDEAIYTIPTAYDPPNVPLYTYPHIHYPDMGNPSYGGGGYVAPGDAYLFTGDMPDYGGDVLLCVGALRDLLGFSSLLKVEPGG
ncbi:hypothetical protein Tco_1365735 [Tanacetum coccineum]